MALSESLAVLLKMVEILRIRLLLDSYDPDVGGANEGVICDDSSEARAWATFLVATAGDSSEPNAI